MRSFDVETIENIITELDIQLTSGFAHYQELKVEAFDQVSKAPEEEQAKWATYLQGIVNKWTNDVLEILNKKLDHRYHAYHFASAKPDVSYTYSNIHPHMSTAFIQMEYRMKALEEVILRLEERLNLSIRQEIAEKEQDADILYRITYSDHSREIKLNGIILAKPDFNSENDRFFSYVYNNPNRPITRKEIEEATKEKLKKNNSDTLRDLGFTGPLRSVFFAQNNKTTLMFTNPIFKKFALEHELPPINFHKLKRSKGK